MDRPQIVLAFILGYMLLCIVVGLWAMRRTRSTHDFFMAGSRLGFLVTSVAIFSSTMSGWGFVGGPGLVYKIGAGTFWMIVSTGLGFCGMFYLLGKRLRLMAEVTNPVSLPDVVTARYDSRSTGFLTAIAILLGVLGYLGTQILAMAMVLQSVLADVASIGLLPLGMCMAISCAGLVFYCVTGGIIASVYTDLVQGIIMVVAALLVVSATVASVDGGLEGMTRTILADDPEAMSPWGTRGIVGCLSWYFVFVFGVAGQPHLITKLMMTRKPDDARVMLPMSVVGFLLTALLWISIGLCMRTLVLQGGHAPLGEPDQASPEFLKTYAHPVLAGVVFAGLMAAIMSTADSFLNIGAAAIVHDIPRAIRGRSLNNELLWARVATVVIAAVASGVALASGKMVALLGAVGWSVFSGAIVPTVAIGFNWKRATPLACNLAILTSLVLNVGLQVFSVTLPHLFYNGAIALLASLTVFYFVSICSAPPKLDPDIETAMDL